VKHEKQICASVNRWYHGRSTRRGGYWQSKYVCPVIGCGREAKFIDNFLGRREVFCDGEKFTKEFLEK
jgi:hypothetical protein